METSFVAGHDYAPHRRETIEGRLGTLPEDDARQTLLPEGGPNPLAMASQILADEWNIWILAHALTGTSRFNQWKQAGSISNAALASGLLELSDLGLFDRVRYQERPERFEYRLTSRGRSVWPTLVGIWAWERRWSASYRPAFDIVHNLCGDVLEPHTHCAHCHEEVIGRQLNMVVGPSGGWTRSIPVVANKRRSRSADSAARQFPETMTLIGDRWSWAVLGAAFRGVTRYSEFTQFLGGPAPTISDRLRSFCGIEVMTAVPDRDRPDWFDYRLTTKGRGFLPIILSTVEWGQKHFRSPEGKALIIRHEPCGRVLRAATMCGACGETVQLEHLRVRASTSTGAAPGAGAES